MKWHIGHSHWSKFKTAQVSDCFNIQTSRSKVRIFLSSITDLLDHYLKAYGEFIVISNFNESETSSARDLFLDEQKCKNIIKKKTCSKLLKGLYIDLISTSRPS